MDFKKLSLFIIGFGLVVLTMGAIWYLANLPVERGDEGGNIFASLISTHDENLRRSAERSSATWAIGFGVVVAFVGIAIRASARNGSATKPEGTTKEETAPQPNDPAAVPCPFCSKPLERGTWQTYCIHCYQQLPSETKAELARAFEENNVAE